MALYMQSTHGEGVVESTDGGEAVVHEHVEDESALEEAGRGLLWLKELKKIRQIAAEQAQSVTRSYLPYKG